MTKHTLHDRHNNNKSSSATSAVVQHNSAEEVHTVAVAVRPAPKLVARIV